ncbi:flagellar hook-length control protein FliK [Acidimangrovimonas sediminis]|uniref:flagellar hook-length control protein FliK n=1 Tax=Acidimangrovimonas sediminis TaxID=2056283 RepID=UPI001304B283|nr:flagellar hook-length control protein FliK [Acidimangrovimonas sediminis]
MPAPIHGSATSPPATSVSGPDPQAAARPVASQLATAVARHADSSTVELALSPEELGRVRMVIRHDTQVMSVAIHADRPETLDLMRRHAEVLAQEFRAQGYSGTAFSFTGGEGGAAGRGSQAPPSAPIAPAAGDSSRGEAANAGFSAPPPRARYSADGLDLRL